VLQQVQKDEGNECAVNVICYSTLVEMACGGKMRKLLLLFCGFNENFCMTRKVTSDDFSFFCSIFLRLVGC